MLILNVATEPIKIDINSQKASLNSHTILPQLQMQTEAAQLEIRQPKGELQIDLTAFRYSYGIKNGHDFSRDNAQEAKSIGLQAIGSIVERGNRMARIDIKVDAVAEQAADSSVSPLLELTWAPLAKPEIHYQENHPQITFIAGGFDLTLNRGSVQTAFQPAQVNVSVSQYPSIRKWTSENKVDLML